jgi:ribosomal-protein-alanine N-acetyltransferase
LQLKIPKILETERLIIRPFGIEDCEAFKAFMLDEKATKYLDFSEDQKTPERAVEIVSEVIASYESSYPIFSLAVIEKKTGQFIGSCGFSPLENEGEVECYYTVVRSKWGKGYATEFIRRLMEYGFDELNIERIVAFMRKENPASQKVSEKLGMTQSKTLRDVDLAQGKLKYSIDRNQFNSNRSE